MINFKDNKNLYLKDNTVLTKLFTIHQRQQKKKKKDVDSFTVLATSSGGSRQPEQHWRPEGQVRRSCP